MNTLIRLASTAVLLALALSLTGCAALRSFGIEWWERVDVQTPTPPAPVPPAPGDSTTPPGGNPAPAPDAGTGGTIPPSPTPEPAPSPVPEPAPAPVGVDALDLGTVVNLIVKNSPGVTPAKLIAAPITATLRSAETDGSKLWTRYDPYDFGPGDGSTDAIAYFFYERDGRVVGGKFDYWRIGGQGTKDLENVHGNYGGHVMPSKGTRAWTMISSKDGKQRSNTAAVTWR